METRLASVESAVAVIRRDRRPGEKGTDGRNGRDGRDIDPVLFNVRVSKAVGDAAAKLERQIANSVAAQSAAVNVGELRAIRAEIGLRVSEAVSTIRVPVDGKPGIHGKDGSRGPKGDVGPMGPMPSHRWEGTKLQFEQPSGEWGVAVDLQGPAGQGSAPIGGGGGFIVQSGGGNGYFPSGW